MPLWFAALMGLVQGLTEFLPVSSTAHLRIAPALLGQVDPGSAYTAVLQLGTLVAVVTYFARDLFVVMPLGLLRDRKGPEARCGRYSKSPSMATGDFPALKQPPHASYSGRPARLTQRSPRSSTITCASPPRKVL